MLTATITGKDDVSLQVLRALDRGERVMKIPSLFPVTVDQAKILSRYRRFLLNAKGNIREENHHMMKQLGIKVLKMAPLFKAEDWEGINDILSVVTPETKREEIGMLMEALQEKRKRLHSLQQEVNEKRKALVQQEKAIQEGQKELEYLERQLNESVDFLKKYSKPVRDFLLEHVGIYEGEWVLAKRLDIQWRKLLKERGWVVYDELKMIHRITDLDSMAENLSFRIKRGYRNHYDENQAEIYYSKRGRNTPNSAYYILPTGLASNLQKQKQDVLERLKQLKEQRKEVERELTNLRKVKPTSFLESVEARQILNTKDVQKHGKLQHIALQWLLENDYVALAEFTLPNKKKVDVIGYSRKGRVVVVEAKTSWEDWIHDDKWTSYMEYCDEIYFLVPPDVYATYRQNESRLWKQVKVREESVGILVWDGKNLIAKKSSDGHMKIKHPTELLFELARESSKKYVYGHLGKRGELDV